jgi:putative ABC transport system substrate-binding protein
MRCAVVLILAFGLWLVPAAAQSPEKVYHLGILTHGFVPDANDSPYKRAVEGARLLGFDVGRNVELHWAAAEGDNARLPMLARDLVENRADIILAIGDGAARAAKDATGQIPVVMISADPVALGLVDSLAKPGGNLTGVVVYGSVADGKRLEMLAEFLGAEKTVAYLVDATVGQSAINKVEQAAASIKMRLLVFRAAGPSDYDAVFRAIKDAGASALLLGSSLNFLANRVDLAARAASAGLPMMCQWREMAQAGCLLTYGTNLQWVFGRIVNQITSILAFGQKPGDLPVEQATNLDLIINLKTARALGATIPAGLGARANEMIE